MNKREVNKIQENKSIVSPEATELISNREKSQKREKGGGFEQADF